MLSALIALPFVAQLVAPLTLDESGRARALASADVQSQFTSPRQSGETMRFREMDRNSDGVITRAEWRGSEQSFRVHDWNSDGILSAEEVRPGAVRPGAREDDSGIVDDREDTFENLDANGNNRIERGEWHGSGDAFQWLDRNNDGTLSRREVVGGGQRRAAARPADDPREPNTSSVGTAGRQDCVANAARVVDDIYQQVLERPADEASAGMTQALASGRMTVRDIVAHLAKSEEHANRYYWQPMATSLYRQMLNRDPSEQEQRQMAADLASGQRNMTDIIARTARRASNSDEEAVRILYRRLLGREADPEGLRGFTELARRDGIEAVARDIVASPEYRQRGGTSGLAPDDMAASQTAVRTLYRRVLGRDPDPIGLRDLSQAAATSNIDAVVDRMVTSLEYQRLYGSDVVPGRGIRYCGRTR